MPSLLKIFLLAALAGLLFLFPLFWDPGQHISIDSIIRLLEQAGLLAPALYMVAMALAVIVSPIPSVPLDIAAGVFFGPLLGTAYSVIGALAGAVVSFLIARSLGREAIERFLGGHVNFCSRCSDRILTKIVLLSRLLPVVSFDIVSYGAGLTRMSLLKFSLATLFGMIPLTFAYNYFGSALVFGKGWTLGLGALMVVFFFLVPRWMEKKGWIGEGHRKD